MRDVVKWRGKWRDALLRGRLEHILYVRLKIQIEDKRGKKTSERVIVAFSIFLLSVYGLRDIPYKKKDAFRKRLVGDWSASIRRKWNSIMYCDCKFSWINHCIA